MFTERRHSARVAILGRLHGQAIALDVPVKVQDLSLGGMAIETPVPFPVGAEQDFGLTLGDDSTVLLKGRIARCLDASREGRPLFRIGVEFIDDEEAAEDDGVGRILERLD